MKQIVFVLLLFLFTLAEVSAQSYNMVVTKTNGNTVSIPISDISDIKFDGVVSVNDYEKLAGALSTFQLLQNYPNPFNPSTTIEYNIPTSGTVKVQLFDISGRLLRVLEQGDKNKGNYRAVWDGKDNNGHLVASGTYIYTVSFNNSNISKKLLLLK